MGPGYYSALKAHLPELVGGGSIPRGFASEIQRASSQIFHYLAYLARSLQKVDSSSKIPAKPYIPDAESLAFLLGSDVRPRRSELENARELDRSKCWKPEEKLSACLSILSNNLGNLLIVPQS
jgi:hypothetical protein